MPSILLVVKILFVTSDSNPAPYRGDNYYTAKSLPDSLTMQPPDYTPPSQPDNGSSLDAILSSNKDLIVDKLKMLQTGFYERRYINQDVSKQIESDLTKSPNNIIALENVSYFSMQRDWEEKKFDLWKELRMEQTSYFRDVSMIQKELRDTMLEYITEKQSQDLFK